MGKLYWRYKKNGRWTWRKASDSEIVDYLNFLDIHHDVTDDELYNLALEEEE